MRNLNLTIQPGSVVALVGPSGAGKTTFCHLIPRFYEPERGRVLVDGMDVNRVNLHSLREAIGIVQQDVFLFTGTIRDNIAYGKPGATVEQIEQAARHAGAHSFIRGLPAGYDTHIGEKGIVGRTTLIIAHRLSTIRNADEIIVLAETGIVQRGTHQQLIVQGGLYADLYNAQTGLVPDRE